MNNKVEKALEIHAASFNCAQSVFLPYAADYGVDEQLALKIATCFGTGAKCGNICGAASGGLMVLGLKYGHIDADTPDQKKRSGEIAADFLARFKEANGSLLCRELVGGDLMNEDVRTVLKENGTLARVCNKAIQTAAEIVGQVLEDYE